MDQSRSKLRTGLSSICLPCEQSTLRMQVFGLLHFRLQTDNAWLEKQDFLALLKIKISSIGFTAELILNSNIIHYLHSLIIQS